MHYHEFEDGASAYLTAPGLESLVEKRAKMVQTARIAKISNYEAPYKGRFNRSLRDSEGEEAFSNGIQ